MKKHPQSSWSCPGMDVVMVAKSGYILLSFFLLDKKILEEKTLVILNKPFCSQYFIRQESKHKTNCSTYTDFSISAFRIFYQCATVTYLL
jgi:hypothetical protein